MQEEGEIGGGETGGTARVASSSEGCRMRNHEEARMKMTINTNHTNNAIRTPKTHSRYQHRILLSPRSSILHLISNILTTLVGELCLRDSSTHGSSTRDTSSEHGKLLINLIPIR